MTFPSGKILKEKKQSNIKIKKQIKAFKSLYFPNSNCFDKMFYIKKQIIFKNSKLTRKLEKYHKSDRKSDL